MTYGIKINEPIRILDNETIGNYAPAAMATRPVNEASSKYTFVPTMTVVNVLRDAGWLPVYASQMGCRDDKNMGFNKHVIKFTREDLISNIGDYRAELNLWNSHNLGSAFLLNAGAHRKVCDNGMHVFDIAANFSHKHIGFSMEDFIKSAVQVGKKAEKVIGTIDNWNTIDLEENERGVFASAAHQFLFADNQDGFAPIKPQQLLETRRFGDKNPDLWTTFNVIQENATKGGLKGINRKGKAARTRAVNSLDKDRKINEALWALTEKMAELKTA